MSTSEQQQQSPSTGSLNIDPRLHQMQDTERSGPGANPAVGGVNSSNNASGSGQGGGGDDQAKAALQQLYQTQRDSGYGGASVQALLKQIPAHALPPDLAAVASGGAYNPYGDEHGEHNGEQQHHHHSHSSADPDGLEHNLVDGDGSGAFQMTGEGSPGDMNRGGRKKRSESNAEDWTRIRKDNHKEVERRRRGTINQGINELSALMPTGGSSDKAKGAILNRAVTYIRQLKENEARNIEKWTLEKLLMDQAMGELQATIDETRRRWEEERAKVQALEAEVTELRSQLAGGDSASKRSRVE